MTKTKTQGHKLYFSTFDRDVEGGDISWRGEYKILQKISLPRGMAEFKTSRLHQFSVL